MSKVFYTCSNNTVNAVVEEETYHAIVQRAANIKALLANGKSAEDAEWAVGPYPTQIATFSVTPMTDPAYARAITGTVYDLMAWTKGHILIEAPHEIMVPHLGNGPDPEYVLTPRQVIEMFGLGRPLVPTNA